MGMLWLSYLGRQIPGLWDTCGPWEHPWEQRGQVRGGGHRQWRNPYHSSLWWAEAPCDWLSSWREFTAVWMKTLPLASLSSHFQTSAPLPGVIPPALEGLRNPAGHGQALGTVTLQGHMGKMVTHVKRTARNSQNYTTS